MKTTEIRALDDGDLQVQLDKQRRELFNLRVKAATESLDNPARIGQLRRDVARMLTVRRQRQLEGRTGE